MFTKISFLFCLCCSTVWAKPITVVTSFSILGDLVKQVGAEHVQVYSLVGVNSDAHVYQPSPQDSKKIAQANLVVSNGLGFDAWMTKLVAGSGYKGKVVVASAGIKPLRSIDDDHHHGHTHEEVDPHAWQDPLLVKSYIDTIAKALAQVDPARSQVYFSNAKRYQSQLLSLDKWATQQFATIPKSQRRVLSSHDAFAYLASRYQIEFVAVQGVNTDVEPTAKEIASLIKLIRAKNIRYYYVENMSNPRLISQIAKETGAKPGGKLFSDSLSEANGLAPNYLKLIQHNVTVLIQGMKK